jgi:hypothetical protein
LGWHYKFRRVINLPWVGIIQFRRFISLTWAGIAKFRRFLSLTWAGNIKFRRFISLLGLALLFIDFITFDFPSTLGLNPVLGTTGTD